MTLGAPALLVAVLAVPALLFWYVAAERRRRTRAAALAAQGLSPGAGPAGRSRHVAFGCFLAAVAALALALARPETTIKVPHEEGTVVLALDVSNSMRATDVQPSRIEAAKTAARSFVTKLPSAMKVGVVAFGDGAVVVQTPTTAHADAVSAINHVSVGGGTSVGQGLLTSLDAIAGKQLTIDEKALQNDEGSVNVGYYGGAAIVLFSDGENLGRPDPASVAQVASVAGVRVHTIGVGTEQGTVFQLGGFSIATALHREVLTQVSTATDGTYHPVTDGSGLDGVRRSVRLHLKVVSRHSEVTAALCMAAIALLLAGAAVTVVQRGRIV